MKYEHMLVMARAIAAKGNMMVFGRSTRWTFIGPMGVYGKIVGKK